MQKRLLAGAVALAVDKHAAAGGGLIEAPAGPQSADDLRGQADLPPALRGG